MIDKLIVIPNKYIDIDNLRNVGITTFLLPLEEYSIGYNSFSIAEINKIGTTIYILINRILSTKEIEKLEADLLKINNIKGIFFEDLGVFEKLRNRTYELINYQCHFGTNYHSINFMLEANMKSYVVPNDLTFEEIKEVVANVVKPVVLFVFGQSEVMYSRRKLLSNYRDHYALEQTDSVITELVSKISFDIKESDYGSYLFDHHYYDGSELFTLSQENVLYYLINAQNFDLNKLIVIIDLIKNNKTQLIKENDPLINDGFLSRETVYQVKGDE